VKGEKRRKVNRLQYQFFILVLTLMMVLPTIVFIAPVKANPLIDGSSVVCKISFEPPILTDVQIGSEIFTQVSMPNCISQAKPGEPALPVFPARILIPQGKTVSNIRIKSSVSVDVIHDLVSKPVAPQQELYPFSEMPNNAPFVKNDAVYDSSDPVFDSRCSEGEIGFCRGFSILTVYLYPVQYVPKTGRLYFFPDMTITVEFDSFATFGCNNDNKLLRYSKQDQDAISDMVENPVSIISYDPDNDGDSSGPPMFGGGGATFGYTAGICDPADSYEYVIITNNALKDTAGYSYNWSDLLNHRQSFSGLSGIIVTVEEIDACIDYWNITSLYNDTQAHIREFCKDAYEDWGMEYLLLGGDCDSDGSPNIVPYRLFEDRLETDTYDTMPCDMYYNHLDGDWYYTGSGGMWGGGRSSGVNDPYAEFYLGRLTVSNAEQISNIVKKIIWYDTAEQDSWFGSSAFFGGDLGWPATSKQYLEEIREGTGSFSENEGFEEWNSAYSQYSIDTSERLYDADFGTNAQYKAAVEQSINDDTASIINHLDHASSTSALSMTSTKIRSLTNIKPFIAYSQGCLSGRFISGVTTEQMLTVEDGTNQALAVVLNTGYGYGSLSTTAGASQHQMKFFWDYFFNASAVNQNNWQLGKAQAHSKDKMSAYVDSLSWSHAWCYVWYSSHLFGDPAQTLRVVDSNNAVDLSSENPSNEASNVSIINATLSVTIEDPEGEPFNWTIETSPNIGNNSGNYESNGSKSCNISGLSFDTSYTWFVNATDGNSWTNETYSFSTVAESVNNSPTFSSPSIENGTTGVSLNISFVNITIKDPEGNSFNWTIETSPNIGNNSGNNESNGSRYCNVSGLTYSTTYYWFVNATDGNSWTNETYSFTTEDIYVNNPPYAPSSPSPSDDATGESISIDLSWAGGDPDADNVTYDVYFSSVNPPSQVACNQSGTSYDCGSMSYNTLYYWKIVAWDDNNASNTSLIWSFTTASASPPPSSPPSSPPSNPNKAPSADAGGPYTSCISQSISFNGSNSNDPDGSISSYIWDFGGENIGEGQIVTHSYLKAGTYNVTLKVTDDDGAADTDITTATITTCWDEEEETGTNISSEVDYPTTNISLFVTNDIPDDIVEQIVTDLPNVSSIEFVSLCNVTHYIIDISEGDSQGNSFVFYNATSNKKTTAYKVDEQTLLIDEDDDGVWDYEYNIATQAFSPFMPNKEVTPTQQTQNIKFWMVIVGSIIFTFISLGTYLRDKSKHTAFNKQHNHLRFLFKKKRPFT